MWQITQVLVQSLCVAMTLWLASVAMGQDTDGDGLLDLIDAPGFDANASGTVFFDNLGIEDLDGANLLTQVHDLSLFDNQITSIESGDFGGLNNLQRLELFSNQITSIESGDFDGLNNLHRLALFSNQITTIESGAFDGLNNLQQLDLSDNPFTSIESGAFGGLTNLNTIWVQDGQVTILESGAFRGSNNLEWLVLDYNQITTIESGAFDSLSNLEFLVLEGNRITSIESGTFDGLANLYRLCLYENQITSIESGAFDGLNNLQQLGLSDNPFTELNFSQAEFRDLMSCDAGGFCIDGDTITSLLLDDATLSNHSFDVIVSETTSISDVSLVGLRFSDEVPGELSNLLSIDSLDNVTVDQALFDAYTDEFNGFAAGDGNTLTVIGYGDSNLDGYFNSSDLVAIFNAGEYEDGIAGNSYWTEGDWNSDGDFDSSDLVIALSDGNYEQGPVNAVPEPSSLILLMIGFLSSARFRLVDTAR